MVIAGHGLVVVNISGTRPLPVLKFRIPREPFLCNSSSLCESADQISPIEAPTENTIETRLDRLEQTIQLFGDSLDRLAQTIHPPRAHYHSQTNASNEDRDSSHRNTDHALLYMGPSNSFSFLKEASANINAIPQPPGDVAQHSAHSELQYLSSRLTTAEMQTSIRSSAEFHVPPRGAGYRLISRAYLFLRLHVLAFMYFPLIFM